MTDDAAGRDSSVAAFRLSPRHVGQGLNSRSASCTTGVRGHRPLDTVRSVSRAEASPETERGSPLRTPSRPWLPTTPNRSPPRGRSSARLISTRRARGRKWRTRTAVGCAPHDRGDCSARRPHRHHPRDHRRQPRSLTPGPSGTSAHIAYGPCGERLVRGGALSRSVRWHASGTQIRHQSALSPRINDDDDLRAATSRTCVRTAPPERAGSLLRFLTPTLSRGWVSTSTN